MDKEQTIKASYGYAMLMVLILIVAGVIAGLFSGMMYVLALIIPIVLILPGFFIVRSRWNV